MNEITEIIRKQLPKIPPHVRNYLQSDAYPQVMRDVVSRYNLQLDTAAQVEIETTLLLIGMTPPSEYQKKLEAADLTPEQAKVIAADMNAEVFKPLVEAYKKPQEPTFTNAFADEVAQPKEEQVEVEEDLPEPEETPAPEPQDPAVEEKKPEKKYAIDPYREPIE